MTKRVPKRARLVAPTFLPTPDELGFGRVFDGLADAVVVTDRDDRIVLWNPAAERLFGYTADAIVGAPNDRLLPERLRASTRVALAHWRRHGAIGPMLGLLPLEAVMCAADGTEIEVEMTLSEIDAPGRDETWLVALIRDNRAHKRLERELLASESRWRALVEHAPDLIVTVDGSGRVTFVNARAGGLGLAPLLRRPVTDLVEPAFRGELRRVLQLLREPHAPVTLEMPAHLSDGRRRWFRLSVGGLPGAAGLLVVATDVTETREAAEATGALAQQLAEAEELASLGSWSWLIAEDQVTWSPTLYKIFGTTAEAFSHSLRAFMDFVHPDDFAATEAVLGKAFQEQGDFAYEARIIRPDGATRTIRAAGRVIPDARGLPVRLAGFCQDITDLRTAIEAIAHRDAELAQVRALDRFKTDLLNAVSHELRTPLTAVIGYAEFLEDDLAGPLTAGQRHFLRGLQAGAVRLRGQIDDLLDFACLEAGAFALNLGDASLGQVIAELEEDLAEAARAAALTLTIEEEDPPAPARLDVKRIGQVLVNFVRNAIKFTPAGGRVVIRVRREGDAVRAEVADTGPGVAAEDRDRLFQRFSQLAAGRALGGTGIGLALCRAIAEAHAGQVGVESAEGHGATFWLRLPLAGPPTG